MAHPPGDRIASSAMAEVIENEIRTRGSVQRVCEVMALYDGTDEATVARWLYRVRTGESETISVEYADRILTALGRTEILEEMMPTPAVIYERIGHCEDCGGEIEEGVEPIDWSDEDQAFIAEVPELPGCAADGTTRQEAWPNAEVVISEWLKPPVNSGDHAPAASVSAHSAPGIRNVGAKRARSASGRRRSSATGGR